MPCIPSQEKSPYLSSQYYLVNKVPVKALIFGGFALNMLALGYVGSQHITKNLNTKTAISARQESALNIAKHVISDTCWEYYADYKLKIGDRILTNGSETGKVPTSCFYNKPTKQFIEVAYLDKELQAVRIFSLKEIRAAKTNLLAGDK